MMMMPFENSNAATPLLCSIISWSRPFVLSLLLPLLVLVLSHHHCRAKQKQANEDHDRKAKETIRTSGYLDDIQEKLLSTVDAVERKDLLEEMEFIERGFVREWLHHPDLRGMEVYERCSNFWSTMARPRCWR